MSMQQIATFPEMASRVHVNAPDASLEQMVLNHPSVQRMMNSKDSGSESVSLFTPGAADPLDLIDEILSDYIEVQTAKADAMAQEIEVMSNAIAEINRLWGLVMQDNLSHTDPNSNDTKTPLGDGASAGYLTEIDRLIRDDLGNPDGIKVITGKDLGASKSWSVTYGELQELNATMTAYCDTIQVDLDTKQQEFKNVMTEITSAQEEIRDVRRAIVAVTQG
jgi:hypothetical protein